ncbi:MAG: hypothetical protein QOD77_346 [Thermoplasmata archaeon]|nr:hypothetical protein [Thermoplasmata archaeon]
MRRIASVLLLVVLACLPAVQAGSATDPEITDPAGDGDSSYSGAAGQRDLVAVWIDDALVDVEGGKAFRLHALNSEDIDHWGSLLAVHERIRVGFVPTAGLADGAVEAYVYIRPSVATSSGGTPGTEFVTCRGGFATAAGGSENINTEATFTASFAGAEFVCDVPLSFLPGFDPAAGGRLNGLYATFEVVSRGPVSGNPPGSEVNPPRVLETADRAPDDGVGRPWPAPGSLPAGDAGLNLTLKGAAVEFGGSFPNATTRVDRYSWPDAGATIRLAYNATVEAGTLRLVAMKADGTELLNRSVSATGSSNATLSGTGGNLTFEVRYEGFKGMLSASAGPVSGTTTTPTTGSGTTPTGTGGSSTGTGGSQGSGSASGTDTEGAPHLGVAALALVLAFAARRKR